MPEPTSSMSASGFESQMILGSLIAIPFKIILQAPAPSVASQHTADSVLHLQEDSQSVFPAQLFT